WLFALANMAIACGRLGDRERAATVHRHLLPYRGRPIAAGGPGLGSSDLFLGIAAATARMYDAAELHFEDAAASAPRHGWRVVVAHVEAHHAETLLARDGDGDRDRAR